MLPEVQKLPQTLPTTTLKFNPMFIPPPPPPPARLNAAVATGPSNVGSRAAKVLAVVMIGLGAAALCTGLGTPLGAALIACGGLVFGASVEADLRSVSVASLGKNGILNVVTYNVGAGLADFRLACLFNGLKDEVVNHELYQAAKLRTAAYFSKLVDENGADVIMLQEITGADVLIGMLREKGFQVLSHGLFNDDCAIVLHPKRFEVLETLCADIDRQDTALVVARDRRSQQTFLFGSAHVPGMYLVEPDPRDALDGDNYLRNLVSEINAVSTRYPGIVRILGADMNRNPERWSAPFTMLKGAGFDLHRSNEPTEVIPTQPEYPMRELDFIFSSVRSPTWWDWLSGTTKKTPEITSDTTALLNFEMEHGVPYASDHRPVKATIDYIYNRPGSRGATQQQTVTSAPVDPEQR